MLEGGFILLHRSILRWEWYGDLNTARLFIQGVADLVVNVANGKTKAVVLESGAFKKAGKVYSAFNIYLLSAWPTINADNSYVAAVRVLGNQQATSVTLNTSGYNGSYYVLMGFSNNNSRSFTGYIYSLKCNF